MKLNLEKISRDLESACLTVSFALLHGSAKDGILQKGSDLDLAVYTNVPATLGLYQNIDRVITAIHPGVDVDIGILNKAEPIYAYEALKGRLLFSRDQEEYLNFFSLTCRLYESQLADYARQHRYRLEAHICD